MSTIKRNPLKVTIECLCGCKKTKDVRRDTLKRNKGMFFSNTCGARWRREHPNEKPQVPESYLEIETTCLHCKNTFTIGRDESAAKVYCSDSCKNERRNLKQRTGELDKIRIISCEWCSRTIEASGIGSKLKRFCSSSCQVKSRDSKETEKECKCCKKTFIGRRRVEYCSTACKYKGRLSEKECQECKTEFTGFAFQVFCSEQCRTVHQKRLKREKVKKNTERKKNNSPEETAQSEFDRLWFEAKRAKEAKKAQESKSDVDEKFLVRGNQTSSVGGVLAGSYLG